ncbi:putative phage abortive infection protein [Flavobacterium sp.]|uniref:putative phage abortive infection protein n=1 Tax=Flavobacterium sp. TaxID=239 RepID=UPI00286C948C|nr:putative phage abortive infection protein [Flavobacterium sp.]
MKIIKQIAFFLISIVVIGNALVFFNEKFEFFCANSQGSEYYQIYGVLGDYVGGILGTIIGFITLILVYLTYTSQKDELKLQSQLIAQQQFESTFFNMLNVHRELKNSLKIKKDKNNIDSNVYEEFFIKEFKGIEIIERTEVFSFLKIQFKKLFFYQGTEAGTYQPVSLDKLYKDVHKKNENEKIIYLIQNLFFKKHQNVISHYCRNIYQILKYIRENEKQETLGKEHTIYLKYTNILQSQLNNDEQFLLFYNFIAFDNKDKEEFSTVNLCNHYQFLENLGYENLLNNELHNNQKFYSFNIK